MELFRLLGTIAIDNTNANQAIRDTTDTDNNANDEVSGVFEKIGGVAVRVSDEVARDIKEIISLLKLLRSRQIYLNTGVLAGELAPLLDYELGQIGSRKEQGII